MKMETFSLVEAKLCPIAFAFSNNGSNNYKLYAMEILSLMEAKIIYNSCNMNPYIYNLVVGTYGPC
jgi:hypothetical protein